MNKDQTTKLLWILLLLFIFRVLAQLGQFISSDSLAFLPEFSTWHSDSMPYWFLLLSQVVIIAFIYSAIHSISKGTYKSSNKGAMILLVIGGAYLFLMLVRFLLSVTVMSDHFWFGATLPAIFHVVLALVVLVIGLYERGQVSAK